MQPPVLAGNLLGAIADRVNAGDDAAAQGGVGWSGVGGPGWWVTVVSLVVMFAVGGVAARAARHLARRSTPELMVLLDRSAAFYGRWPEDHLADAPAPEVEAEVARCRRIVELLERRVCAGRESRGPIDGMRQWISLLDKRIATSGTVRSGPAFA